MLLCQLPLLGVHHTSPARDAQHRPRQPAGTPGSSPAWHLPEGTPAPGPARTSRHRAAARAAGGIPGRSPAPLPVPVPLTWPPSRPGSGCGGRSSVRGRRNHPRRRGESTRRSGCEEDAPHRLPHVAAQRPKWLRNSPPTLPPPPPQSLGMKHSVTASASLPPPRSILPSLPPVPDPTAEPELLGRGALPSIPSIPASAPGSRDAAPGEDRSAFRRQSLRSARAFNRLTES